MTSKTSSRLKAVDQARQKLEDLTREGIVAFSFIMTDEGPELMGEEELTSQMFDLFEEKAIFEAAKRIRMRGNVLTHRSTRSLKIVEMQDVFETLLPPTLLPLDELLDYDLIRFAFNKMMKAERLKSLWKTGQDPPASVQEWWGNEDWEVFRLYENQNISKDIMELIRARHQRYKKNAINFFKDKTQCQDECRSLSGGVTKNLTLHWMTKIFFSFYHQKEQIHSFPTMYNTWGCFLVRFG